LLVLAAGWFAGRSEKLISALGYSVVEVSAGVVAISILLGMRLPLDLWPRAPKRERVSLLAAVAVAVGMGGLIVVSRPLGVSGILLETDRMAVLAIVAGATAWALAWGVTNQAAFLRWYGIAVLVAAVPILFAVALDTVRYGELPDVRVGLFLQVACFFLVAGAAGSLVTQELAFRRLLIGQSGDAGLIVVVVGAVLFGLWRAMIPETMGGFSQTLLTMSLGGLVMGSLYLLSRSLLVPALYQGVYSGLVRGLQLSTVEPGSSEVYTDKIWLPMIVATAVAAVVLGYNVLQRAGFLGTLKQHRETDAAGG
jgi:hypothetical protein